MTLDAALKAARVELAEEYEPGRIGSSRCHDAAHLAPAVYNVPGFSWVVQAQESSMPSLRFAELVALLPRGNRLPAKRSLPGFRDVLSSNSWFVEPDLEVQQPLQSGVTSAVLLSAPGAVGKSTLAAELASRTAAALWDLSRFQVGSNTFSGTILNAYDEHSHGVLKDFREGSTLFVFDALDEAQVRAGSQNFDAFLSDLATVLKGPRIRPTLVLLARSETADWMQLHFEEANVPLARLQISYFDQPRAMAFIEKRLDAIRALDGKAPIHRQQPKPFADARTALFQLIYRLFEVDESDAWVDRRVTDFLGYAPVLEAFAGYLDVPNYMSFAQQLHDESAMAKDPWQFLADIMNRLLEREKTKTGTQLKTRLATTANRVGWSTWDVLYEPNEQCRRVLAYHLHTATEPLRQLPTVLLNEYEDAVQEQLKNHPFLNGRQFANVVFREYGYAWGITGGDDSLSGRLRDAMSNRDEPFLPSPLFSRFIEHFGGDAPPVLDGQDFGVFYESLLSRATRPEDTTLTLLQNGDDLRAIVSLDSKGESEIELALLDTGPGVHFWRRLLNADVDIKSAARLGLTGQRFWLGPGVDLECSELTVLSEDVEVDVSSGVRVRAGTYGYGSHAARIRLRYEDRGALAIRWPSASHPWAIFQVSDEAGVATLSETTRGDTLRKFIMMFRRQRTRLERTLRSARWAPPQASDRDDLIELAMKRGVLRRIGGLPVLQFDSSFDSLRSLVDGAPDLSEAALAFATEYLGAEAVGKLVRTSKV